MSLRWIPKSTVCISWYYNVNSTDGFVHLTGFRVCDGGDLDTKITDVVTTVFIRSQVLLSDILLFVRKFSVLISVLRRLVSPPSMSDFLLLLLTSFFITNFLVFKTIYQINFNLFLFFSEFYLVKYKNKNFHKYSKDTLYHKSSTLFRINGSIGVWFR